MTPIWMLCQPSFSWWLTMTYSFTSEILYCPLSQFMTSTVHAIEFTWSINFLIALASSSIYSILLPWHYVTKTFNSLTPWSWVNPTFSHFRHLDYWENQTTKWPGVNMNSLFLTKLGPQQLDKKIPSSSIPQSGSFITFRTFLKPLWFNPLFTAEAIAFYFKQNIKCRKWEIPQYSSFKVTKLSAGMFIITMFPSVIGKDTFLQTPSLLASLRIWINQLSLCLYYQRFSSLLDLSHLKYKINKKIIFSTYVSVIHDHINLLLIEVKNYLYLPSLLSQLPPNLSSGFCLAVSLKLCWSWLVTIDSILNPKHIISYISYLNFSVILIITPSISYIKKD